MTWVVWLALVFVIIACMLNELPDPMMLVTPSGDTFHSGDPITVSVTNGKETPTVHGLGVQKHVVLWFWRTLNTNIIHGGGYDLSNGLKPYESKVHAWKPRTPPTPGKYRMFMAYNANDSRATDLLDLRRAYSRPFLIMRERTRK